MEGFGRGIGDLGGLSTLLSESKQAAEAREGQYQQKPGASSGTVVTKRGVEEVAAASKAASAATASEGKTSVGKANDIWDVEEVPTEDALASVNDGRPAPRYETSYKQSVGTQDTFLGFSDKTPLSSDCTHLVVKIHFPGSKMKDLDVDVKKNRLRATSKTHRLFTYLPVDVDELNGKAQFDSDREVLTLTLPIVHEFF